MALLLVVLLHRIDIDEFFKPLPHLWALISLPYWFCVFFAITVNPPLVICKNPSRKCCNRVSHRRKICILCTSYKGGGFLFHLNSRHYCQIWSRIKICVPESSPNANWSVIAKALSSANIFYNPAPISSSSFELQRHKMSSNVQTTLNHTLRPNPRTLSRPRKHEARSPTNSSLSNCLRHPRNRRPILTRHDRFPSCQPHLQNQRISFQRESQSWILSRSPKTFEECVCLSFHLS